MTDVTVIPCEPAGSDILELLDDLISRAIRGELSSIAVATVDREGVTASAWSEAPSFGTLIGSVAVLQHNLIHRLEGLS